jgi:hypothetical protein
MTEYEVADLALSREFQLQGVISTIFMMLSTVSELIQQYMTVLFAYITAAFFIGNRLDRPQIWVFSVLYLFWQLWTLTAIWLRQTAVALMTKEFQTLTTEEIPISESIPMILRGGAITLLIAALLVSLYFMWAVRHPKTE